jgi:hypothetical protein
LRGGGAWLAAIVFDGHGEILLRCGCRGPVRRLRIGPSFRKRVLITACNSPWRCACKFSTSLAPHPIPASFSASLLGGRIPAGRPSGSGRPAFFFLKGPA